MNTIIVTTGNNYKLLKSTFNIFKLSIIIKAQNLEYWHLIWY